MSRTEQEGCIKGSGISHLFRRQDREPVVRTVALNQSGIGSHEGFEKNSNGTWCIFR